jgi:predicted ester cyclase
MVQKILIGMSLLLVAGLLAGCSGVKKADLDAAKAQVNTLQNEVNAVNTAKSQADANKSLVRSYYDALNKGDFEAIKVLLSSAYKRYLSAINTLGKPLDAAGQVQRLIGLRITFPDLQITVENLIAEGDYVAINLTAQGTQQGALLGTVAPTGRKITVSGFEIIRIENGKMIEHWGGTDTFDILIQMGAIISVSKLGPKITIEN